MAFQAPPLPPEFAADEVDRKRWSQKVVDYAKASGLDGIRCARRNDGAAKDGSKAYFRVRDTSVRYHLRTVLPTHLIFDLGDLIAGDPADGDWSRCRIEAHAIAAALTFFGFPFLAGPTSSKGFHIELFLDPAGPQSRCRDEGEDYRKFIAAAIVGKAKEFLWPDEDVRWHKRVIFDRLLIAPGEGSRLATEFGERKAPSSARRKFVWHEGFGPMANLPETRDEVYLLAAGHPARPTSIPVALDAERLDTRHVFERTGRPCPQGPACLDNERWGCDDCPSLD